MLDNPHLAIIKDGVEAWNKWRLDENAGIPPDLSQGNLSGMKLAGAKLNWTNLWRADLRGADLRSADLIRAQLISADASDADLTGADLRGAILSSPDPERAHSTAFVLRGATLTEANLSKVDLTGVNLSGATLSDVNLSGANLTNADLTKADLTGADLSGATLVETKLRGATLDNCLVYGISVWGVDLDGVRQTDLRITRRDEPTITTDNLEVAQFLHLMLRNKKIRDIIDTLTSKAVLILGRFTPERKQVLDELRRALRTQGYGYVPILFDFETPASRDWKETVTLLARVARFVIADITDPKKVPEELSLIVPALPSVPIQPILQESGAEFAEFGNYTQYARVLPLHRYRDIPHLLDALSEFLIAKIEEKVLEVQSLHAE